MMRLGWLGMLAMAACGTSEGSNAKVLADPQAKTSYSLGFEVGMDLKRRDVGLDPAVACIGLQDALRGDAARVGDNERKKLVTALKAESRSRRDSVRGELGANNAVAGKQFRADYAKQQGVTALPSGLQYKPIKVGMGAVPTIADTAICHYRLTTIDGVELEDTHASGRPAELVVKRMVKGVAEALQRMPTGSSWQLVVPPDLAYGKRGAPRTKIGPDQTLVFTIDLIGIKPHAVEPIVSAP